MNTKNNFKKIFAIISLLIVVIILVLLLIFNFNKSNNLENNQNGITVSKKETFCISNKNGKYAIFDIDGKQITKFDFSNNCRFYNNSAVVKNDKNEYAIIDNNGKFVVKFGKYKYISQHESLYEAIKNDSKMYFILNSKGKEVYKSEEKLYIKLSNSNSNMYRLELNDKIVLLDFNGKIIDELKKESNISDYNFNCNDRYCSYFTNDKTYVYDLNKGKKIINLTGEYYIQEYLNDTIVFEGQNDNYKIYRKDKLILDTKSRYFKIISDGYAAVDSTITLYDKNGNFIDDNIVFYKDTKNYVTKEDYRKNIYSFYKDGKLAKEDTTISNFQSSNNISDEHGEDNSLIVLSTTNKIKCFTNSYCNSYNFYDYSGNIVNKTPFVKISGGYDSYMKVSDDGEKYYIINNKFEKVSEKYDDIYQIYTNDKKIFYWEIPVNNKYMLLSDNGQKIKENLSERTISSSSLPENIIKLTYDDKIEFYNIRDKKTIVTLNKNIRFNSYSDLYVDVTENGVNKFYSYTTGKMFYSK